MKKVIVLLIVVIAVIGCQSGPKFTDVAGKEWKLTDVRLDGRSINFDRSTLVTEGFGEIFTLTFEADKITGTGAPNRFFAPYTLEKKQAISVKPVAGTLMATLTQPEKLKEHDFFTYISNTNKWNLAGDNLELTSKGETGGEVVMIFKFK